MFSQEEIVPTIHKLFQRLACGTSALVLMGGTLMPASTPDAGDAEAQAHIGRNSTTFVVEIKEHSSTNRQNDVDPIEGQAVFTRGDYAVVDGTIYPDGSIARGSGREPDSNATPLGRYVQRGVFTSEFDQFQQAIGGATNVDPIIAFATEVLVFKDGSSILMDGLWPNAHVAVHRVVLGGTGRFRDVVGEVLEENIGEDTDGMCNLRMTFHIRKAARDGAQDH